MLTVAHVDTESGFSGGQVQVFLLMDGLAAAGVHNLLCCRPGSVEEARAREAGHAVAPVPMANDLHLTAIPRLARAFRREGADLVHLHTGRANWLGGWAARLAGLPALTTRRMDRPVRQRWSDRLVYRRLVRRAVAISPAVERLLREGGVPPDTIRTICSSVDPGRFAVAGDVRARLRRELGVDDDTVLLLGVAQLSRRKGFDVLLDALAAAPPAGPWRLVLAGDGPERPALAEQVGRLGLAERVTLPGPRDDVPALLAAADLFVMPSRAEGLGVAALEAMAAGRPVLASAVGGLADVVVDGETGWLVPPEDAAELGAALAAAVGDGAERVRRGTAGAARVAERFSAAGMVAAYRALYDEILAEARG